MTKRYSLKLMIEILTNWISAAETNGGIYGRLGEKSNEYDFHSMNAGCISAAKTLLNTLTIYPKMTKPMFVSLITNIYPDGSDYHLNRGYSQVKFATTERSFGYGVFDFNSNIVRSIFSDYL